LTLAWAGHGAAAGTLAEAQDAALAGDFAKAESILTGLAEAKDPAALRELARLHLAGQASASDPAQARSLLQQSVAQGFAPAGLDLGYVLLQGIGGPADPEAAREAFAATALADPGNIEARFMWGKTTLAIIKEPQDLPKAIAEIQLAAARKFGPALALVADFYLSGTFVAKDPQRAMSLYQEAYANGHLQSAMTVADLFAFGEMGTVDLVAAGNWYARAASEGDAKAAYAIATLIYMDPQSGDEDLKRAFTFAQSAALAWNEDAQMLLGRMYLDGRAVARDPYEAFKWLDLAATSAVLDAHYLRAIAARELGPELSAQAREEARAWFEANHATPHTHRLMNGAEHVFR
jgi:TPR repeat protein